MRDQSFLRRASEVRSGIEHKELDDGAPGSDLDKSSGITPEDRREIIAAIDEVASRNRLSAGSEILAIKARRKGFIFPLTVNVLAALLTAGGLFSLSLIFKQRDAGIAAGGAALGSAEGKLIQELKRESDSKLQEKDKAITDIQVRLTALDKERNDLAASIEERVGKREAELKTALQAELEQERKRLAGLGLADAAIQDRLKKFETEKTAAFKQELEAFQRRAEAEKAQAEDNYKRLRDEYQKNIAGLTDDRKRIQDDARKREDELRGSMETRTKELEAQSAQAQAGLEQARAQLAGLEDQRAKAQVAEDRVLGLYDTIRTALRDRRFEDAAAGAAALGSYLNDPSVIAIPSLQSRRTTDLFVADALSTLAKEEIDRASADATKLLSQAELVSAARAAAAAADAALKAGDRTTASAKYQEALEKVPEILTAHQYFMNRAQDEETARRARLNDSLVAADAAFQAGDLSQASARYTEALAYLPIDEVTRSSMALRMAQSGALETDRTRRAADTRAAAASVAAARRNLASSQWSEAMTGFISVLSSYPNADQAPEALKGIESARDGMRRDSDAAVAAAAAKTASLQTDLSKSAADLRAENQRLAEALSQTQKDRDAATASLDQAKKDVDSLTERLKNLSAQTADAATRAGAATPQAIQAATSGDYDKLLAEKNRLAAIAGDYDRLQAERNRLASVADKYDRLLAAYKDYEGRDEASVGPDSSQSQLSNLYVFLDGPETRAAFPLLKDFISRTMQGYQQTHPSDDLNNAVNIAVTAASYEDRAARTRYLDSQATGFGSNSFLKSFIRTLSSVLK